MAKSIALINGPNLNLLGTRNQTLYGKQTLDDIVTGLKDHVKGSDFELQAFQSNSEGAIIDAVQAARKSAQGAIINPGAYAHTSIAIRDALEDSPIPFLEVHLSNIYQREEFRRHSYTSEVVKGVIVGFGADSYFLALSALLQMFKK